MESIKVFGRPLEPTAQKETWRTPEGFSPRIVAWTRPDPVWGVRWGIRADLKDSAAFGEGRTIEAAERQLKQNLKQLAESFRVLSAELGV